jgi:hypothetical protein
MLRRPIRPAALPVVMALAATLAMGASAEGAAIPIPIAVRMVVTPTRDAVAPYVFTVTGRVVFRRPIAGGACAGVVSMAVKANGLPLLLKSPKVGPDCRFSEVFTVTRRAKLHGARKLVIAGLWFRLGAPTSVIAPARTVRIR